LIAENDSEACTTITAKAAILISAAMLAGCAFVPDTVHPTYTHLPQANQIPQADQVLVSITAKNCKKNHSVVSVTKDAYGIKMANVYMHIKRDFRNAFIKALSERGFHVSSNADVRVIIAVNKFYFMAHPGFFYWLTNRRNKSYSHGIKRE
jgi:uncharacterized lipoprotein YajG